jgi:hypothetical protein
MDRGPVALFGAIVAVGLGPALWLGAHFGRFDATPPGPPVPVDRTHDTQTQLMGGTGAGENQTGAADNTPVRTKHRIHTEPVTARHSATPSTRPTDVSPSPSVKPSPSRSSATPSATPSESPSAPDSDDSAPPSPAPTRSSSAPVDDGSEPKAGTEADSWANAGG